MDYIATNLMVVFCVLYKELLTDYLSSKILQERNGYDL
jgi:hypothetical protein